MSLAMKQNPLLFWRTIFLSHPFKFKADHHPLHFLCLLCNRMYCVCPGPWPFNLFFPVLFPKAWHHSASLTAADVVPDLSWDIRPKWAGQNQLLKGTTMLVSLPTTGGGSHFSCSGTVKGTAAPTPTWSVPSCWRAWLARLRAPGKGLDPVAVVVNQPSM